MRYYLCLSRLENYSGKLRWILEGEDMPGDVLVVILAFLQSLLNDCSWPIADLRGQLWMDTSRSRRTHALVKSDANGWSSRMQTGGQVGCKRLVKSDVISQYQHNTPSSLANKAPYGVSCGILASSKGHDVLGTL